MSIINAEALTGEERKKTDSDHNKGFDEFFAAYEEFMTAKNGAKFVFPPEQKQRIREELEIIYAPEHEE